MSKPKITRDEEAWELVVTAEITPDHINEHRSYVVAELKKDAHVQGFRPGKAPEDVVIKAVGEAEILRRTIEHAVHHELPEILAAEGANIVDAPKVMVEKAPASLPASEPIVFTARAPLAPEIKLSDYKAVAKKLNAKKEEVVVSDDEHKETQIHLRRERARIEKVETGMEPAKAKEEADKAEEKDLPPLDDDFAKSIGYEGADDFSTKLREHIKTEKELNAKNKFRAELLDALVKDAKISYPAILREYELDEMEGRLAEDLGRMGQTPEKYYEQTKKTRETVRAEWKDAADKRAKVRLVLSDIARQEKIEPDKEKLEHEIEHAKKMYPQAKPDVLRAHITHAMRNEKVLEWLEKIDA